MAGLRTVELVRDPVSGQVGMVIQGAFVDRVQPGSAADRAGLAAGMRIVAIGRNPVRHDPDTRDMYEAIRKQDGVVRLTLQPVQDATAIEAAVAGETAAKRRRLAEQMADCFAEAEQAHAALAKEKDWLVDTCNAALAESAVLETRNKTLMSECARLRAENQDKKLACGFKPFPQAVDKLSAGEAARLEDEVYEYLQQVRKHRAELTSCKICMARKQDVLVLPCRHVSMCEGCSKKVDQCPQCLGAIAERLLPHEG